MLNIFLVWLFKLVFILVFLLGFYVLFRFVYLCSMTKSFKTLVTFFPSEPGVCSSLLHHNLRQWLCFFRIYSRMGYLSWLLETLTRIFSPGVFKGQMASTLVHPCGFGYECLLHLWHLKFSLSCFSLSQMF